jgi:hypothetical protein
VIEYWEIQVLQLRKRVAYCIRYGLLSGLNYRTLRALLFNFHGKVDFDNSLTMKLYICSDHYLQLAKAQELMTFCCSNISDISPVPGIHLRPLNIAYTTMYMGNIGSFGDLNTFCPGVFMGLTVN